MKKEFTKSDLQSGMIVETREEEENKYLVCGDKFIEKNGYIDLKDYDNSLLIKDRELSKFDIIKVYDCIYSLNRLDDLDVKPIWERKDEMEMETKEYIIKQEYIDEEVSVNETIKIEPNNSNGYSHSQSNQEIWMSSNYRDDGFSLTVNSAKEVIKALQEIVDYMEEK